MKDIKLTGCGTALITPFRNGEVDYEAFAALVDRQVAGGIDFLVPLGTTGETPCLENDERIKVLEAAKEHSGGLPILAGGGTNSLQHTIRSMQMLDPYGVDAFLIVVPYYNKPTQEGQYQYFKAVAEATQKPIVLYNVPGRTGVNMTAETTLRLAHATDKIVAVKEASGDIEQMQRIIDGKPENFLVISGDDGITVELIKRGGVGVISVAANAFPETFCHCIHKAMDGDIESAEKQMAEQFTEPLTLIFREGNPTSIKVMTEAMGLTRRDVRLPLVEGSEALVADIKSAIERYDLK